jgi:hypothetical protein
MQGNEREPIHEQLWKSQEEESMQISAEEVCARARRQQRNDGRVGWALVAVTVLIVAAYIRNLTRLHDPWMLAGAAGGLVAVCCFVWISVRNYSGRKGQAEPCAQFLRRMFERKRQWAREMRWAVWLLAPAVLASWWGGGPLLAAKNLGVASPWLLGLAGGPAPLVVMALLLALLSLLMSLEARRLDREIDQLREK